MAIEDVDFEERAESWEQHIADVAEEHGLSPSLVLDIYYDVRDWEGFDDERHDGRPWTPMRSDSS